MDQKDAIEALAAAKGEAVSISIMQAGAPWKDVGAAERNHVDVVGCMGGAASLGLGLALGAPHKKVMILDGDGGLLMQLGSLVTIAGSAPKNYYHFVFDNGSYQSSGNQPVPGLGKFDWCKLALAAGYPKAYKMETRAELEAALPEILASEGPVMIRLVITPENVSRWPGTPMTKCIQDLKASLAAEREAAGARS
jgi:phosphonopyruvate decarboxylase